MSLASGTRVGPYEIVGQLGAGGMGEVYRARDTNLGRDVALKTLPASLTHDPERLARFRREAQVLAALNHPHIASIYGLDESAGHRVLVLELVEGETLADRIARGPVPVDESLELARQIAEALEAAHDKGIIHRDLKPANIALTTHDRVKVLDFGLAKATDASAVSGTTDPLNSPTITSPSMLTGLGVILGTAAYMSPEQAKGRQADKRSDIWAFGCVLFEMLTGKRAFRGDDVSDTLALVLKGEPPCESLPASVPSTVRSLLDGCLKKNPRERIGDISTALFLLRQPAAPAVAAGLRARASLRWWSAALFAVAGIVAGALAIAVWRRPPSQPARPVVRFDVPVPDVQQLAMSRIALAVSPDGTRVAFGAGGRLYLRSLSDPNLRTVAGAEPGIHPVFSPDGEWIVFWSEPALRKISVHGGVPMTVCQIPQAPFGLDWSDSGIIFSQPGRGILRVSPNGGTPEMLVAVTANEGLTHAPQMLPDGKTLLFTLAAIGNRTSTFWDKAKIVVQSLTTGERKTLLEGGSNPRYLPSGHLVYTVEGTMMAVPFDVQQLKTLGVPVPVVEGIRRSAVATGGIAQFNASNNGVLSYVPGPPRTGQDDIFILDRKGMATPLQLPPAQYEFPRVSPDGKFLAFETTDGKNTAVSLYDLGHKSSVRRLTFGGSNRSPIWSRDGKRVAFQSDREGDRGIFWQASDGTQLERLTRAEKGTAHVPEAWSPREDVFLYSVAGDAGWTLWIYSLAQRKATRFRDVVSPEYPTNAAFSGDGRWVAYQIGEPGIGEATLYVEPYPPTGTKYEIGRGGRPLWSREGLELLFIPAPSVLHGVTIRTAPSFDVSAPYSVPRRFGLSPPANARPYDILPDGRLVGVEAASQGGEVRAQHVRVVLNWFEELKWRVPSKPGS